MLGAKTAEPRDNVYCVFLCSHLFRQGRVRLWLHWSIYFAASSLVWFVCDQTDNYPFLCHNWWHFLSELVASIIFRRIGSTVLFYTMGPEFPAAWMLWWSCFFVTPNVLSCRKKNNYQTWLCLFFSECCLTDGGRTVLHCTGKTDSRHQLSSNCVFCNVFPPLYIFIHDFFHWAVSCTHILKEGWTECRAGNVDSRWQRRRPSGSSCATETPQ